MRIHVARAALAAALIVSCSQSFAQITFPRGRGTRTGTSSSTGENPGQPPGPVSPPEGGFQARPVFLPGTEWKGVGRHVITSAGEFQSFAGDHSNMNIHRPGPLLPSVDWEKEMLIVAGMQAGTTTGDTIRIGPVRREDGKIVATVLEVRPEPDDILLPARRKGSLVAAVAIPRSTDPVRIQETSVLLGPSPFLARVGLGLDPGTFEVMDLVGGQALVLREGEAEQIRLTRVNGQPTLRFDAVSGGRASGGSRSVAPVGEETEKALVKAARESGFLDLKEDYGKVIRLSLIHI